MADKNSLSVKQALFVEAYARTGNGKESAIAAGYAPKTAEITASKMLRIPKVEVALKKRLDELALELKAATKITVEKLLEELSAIAFGDLREIATWDHETVALKPSDDLDDRAAKSLKKLTTTENRRYDKGGDVIGSTLRTTVETHDKLKSIEMISKLLGFWVDKNEHTGADGSPIQVEPQVNEKVLQEKILQLMASAGREFK